MTGKAHERDLLRPGVLIPFLVVTAIWGSTWVVIRDQVGTVPATWTVTYRFALATIGMLALAAIRREPLRLTRAGMGIALIVGIAQFCTNFQFVYHAEQHLTSGLVAVIYALLMVPNALLARIFLGQRIHPRFVVGSVVAIAGIALLLLHEYRVAITAGVTSGAIAPVAVMSGRGVLTGIALALSGLFSASISNIVQATPAGRRQAVVPLIAWSMAIGTLIDAVFSLATVGAPVFDTRPQFVLGTAYLAIFGSVITFPLYFNLIRTMGAGRAAYNGVAVPVIAMALSTMVEGYRWTALAIGGAILALAGLVIALSGRVPASAAPASAAAEA